MSSILPKKKTLFYLFCCFLTFYQLMKPHMAYAGNIFEISVSPLKMTQHTSVTTGNRDMLSYQESRRLSEERTAYIRLNLDELSREASQGQGPHLEAMFDLMGCDRDVRPKFRNVLRDQYESIFVRYEGEPDWINAGLLNTVRGDPVLQSNCLKIR